ncbi:MAG: calcium-translocating P-type ATPase, PMCA-type [Bacilli bacterium]|nr:calcium-translocating P-type ATPase, PMCA-type [Bacilli bacterium]
MERNVEGLTEEQVLENRKQYGSNRITTLKKETFFNLFMESFSDPMIRILLIALGIKTIFLIKDFDWYETVGIVIAIFIASFISSISEYGSQKAFERLQDEASKIKCKVKRNGKVKELDVDDVVKGDIIILQSGDRIPSDGIIVKGNISVDESSLNGEAKEQYKYPINNINIKPEKSNEVYRGTVVYNGEAIMLTTSVGDKTFYGSIAKELQERQPESPMKIRLRHLAKIISKIGYICAFLVAFSYLFSVIVIHNNFNLGAIKHTITNFPLMSGYILYALTLMVTVIVVAVPEGLPMMITLVLSSNMKRMLKDNVLVRKLVGIETAGSLNILFSDKTGTLTKGRLEVVGILNGVGKIYYSKIELEKNPKYYDLVRVSLLYNNASYYDETTKKIVGGNITDRALLEFINDNSGKNLKILSNVPFDSKNKYSITVIDKNGKLNLIKGAPEKILPYCRYYYTENGERKMLFDKNRLTSSIQNITKRGIRVLTIATSNSHEPSKFFDLTLVGFIYIKDEVRKEAIEGVKLVKDAHIQTVMITGDNKDTAYAIGEEVGLIDQNSIILTSSELNQKDDAELKNILPNLRIVARALPQDKSRLVRISQELGLVVGMTGDGVNDAPALKKADVGFAMGSGTEVAKEASDIVILDDNFKSITKAILFGRTIFKSIRKFIIFQLTVNLCAVSLSIIGPFIGVDTPVTVIQMLWINMVMDTLAGLAFSFEPPLLEYMAELPKRKDEPIINKYMAGEILFTGLYSSLLCVIFLKLPFIKNFFRMDNNNLYLMTAFFGLFIFMTIFNSFNARTNRLNLLANILRNKIFLLIILFILVVQIVLIYYGGNLFRTAGLTYTEFLLMLLLSATVIPVDWLRKCYLRKMGKVGGV